MIDRMPRRRFLWRMGGGLGGIALAELLGADGLLAGTGRTPGRPRPRADLNGGLHHPRQGAPGDPALHERRRQPDGHLRLQARAGPPPRPAVRPGEPRRGPDERAGQPDEEPVPVPAAWRMRAVGQQRVSRDRRRASTTWRS